jgi:trehalose 6-phosphate phosphatase
MSRILPALPAQAALLLDLDGTLLDFAPTPHEVVVPPGLSDHLRQLRGRLEDAVAIVTGRPLEQIDALLPNIPYAVAGEHGGAIRHAPGAAVERAATATVPDGWIEAARAVADAHPGILLEPKAKGFVLHFRKAPERGEQVHRAMQEIMRDDDGAFALLAAHMAWEVRPRGADKGTAVEALMARPPFAGRRPVYVGDDVTDEDGMRVARAMGGQGLRVQDVFRDPAGVRAWLAALAAAT